HLPFCRITTVYVGLHIQDTNAFVDPRPPEVSKLNFQFWRLANALIKSWATVTALLSIHEDANMKDYVHAKFGDFSIEGNDLWVVGIPVGRYHFDAAQAKFMVAAPHFFNHQANGIIERSTSQRGNRIQNAKAE